MNQMKKYTIGIDFGTLSGRAVLVDAENGRELADATMAYPHAVMDTTLAATGAALPPNFALQDPADYLRVLETVIPAVIQKAGVTAEAVAGLCIDFTCCTVLPIDKSGTPLCFYPCYKGDPHAYVKLWKHHAAQKYADRLNAVATERGEAWLARCGGNISSEYMFPKIYQTLDEAPHIYEAAAAFMEAGDWLTAQLTDNYVCGYQFAAYKSHYDKDAGYPSEDFFAAVDERLTHVVRDKLPFPIVDMGVCVGTVTPIAAEHFGLAVGTAVACAVPDGHVAVASLDTCRAGDTVTVFGTSGSYFVLGDRDQHVPGICGYVKDGLMPGFTGFEAGLCCFGDHFAFAADRFTSPAYVKEAEERGISMLKLLIEKAAAKRPGQSGVVALNWFNGNRSTLGNSDLSGVFVGMTLSTRPEDLMRALIEAVAFGTRHIFEHFEAHGIAIKRWVATGGIARKDPFTMQLFADVIKKEVRIADTPEAPAVGAAVNAAVAAGIYGDFAEAVPAMSRVSDKVYRPDPAAAAVYDRLYAEYLTLYNYFGRGENNVMKCLRDLAADAKEV